MYVNKGPQENGGWGWEPMNDGKAIASGVGAVGVDVRWGRMEKNGRYSYLALSPNSGALRAWLNGCDDLSPATGGENSGGSGNSGSGSGSGGNSGAGGSSTTNGYLQGGLPNPHFRQPWTSYLRHTSHRLFDPLCHHHPERTCHCQRSHHSSNRWCLDSCSSFSSCRSTLHRLER